MHPSPLARIAIVAVVLLGGVRAARPEDPKPADPPPPPRGYIGIQMVPVPLLPPEGRKELGVTVEQGIVVTRVTAGGPAGKAGIRRGDLLLRLNGKALPDTSALVPEDPTSMERFQAELAAIGRTILVGAEVPVVVQREGAEVSTKAVAVDQATLERLETDEAHGAGADEEGARPATPLPPLSEAGEPRPAKEDFEKVVTAPPAPPTWFPATGRWTVEPEEGATPANHVLRQGHPTDPWAVTLLAGPGRAYAAGVATVRFQPVSGTEDASGGVVVRAQDARNYYVVRANALEGNLRLYVVKDGVRHQLATTEVEAPARGTWHTLEVHFRGSSLRATLDGTKSVEATDETFRSGWCGLWTKADSVTLFDDLTVTPIPEAPAPPPR